MMKKKKNYNSNNNTITFVWINTIVKKKKMDTEMKEGLKLLRKL